MHEHHGHTGSGAGAQASRPGILAICFLIVLLDGLDTTSIAFVAPALARQWGLSPAAFTPAFVATSLGAVIGYLACGPLAARWGQRRVGVLSTALFGVGTLLSAFAGNIEVLSALRFAAAIGLGGALPVAVAVAAGAAAARYKETAAMLVVTGLSAGSVVGGIAGAPLMQHFGWQSVFVLGGLLPLALLPLFRAVIPAAGALPAAERLPAGGTVAQLFLPGLARRTVLLWIFAFLIFVDSYALLFWIPTLLLDFGFAPPQVPAGTAAFGMGGLAGSLLMMALVAKLGVKRILAVLALVAIGCVVVISQGALPRELVLLVIGGMGAGLITGCVGQSALAVSFYPSALRTTGVGWAAAAGRVGSLVGPALGGVMLALGWPPRDIVLAAVLPAAAALLALAALAWADRGRADSDQSRPARA